MVTAPTATAAREKAEKIVNEHTGTIPLVIAIAAAIAEVRTETIRECAAHGCMWCTARAEKEKPNG